MADPILHKRSSVAGVKPAAGVLTPGELALNTADGKLFTKKESGEVVEIGGGGAGQTALERLNQIYLGDAGASVIEKNASGVAFFYEAKALLPQLVNTTVGAPRDPVFTGTGLAGSVDVAVGTGAAAGFAAVSGAIQFRSGSKSTGSAQLALGTKRICAETVSLNLFRRVRSRTICNIPALSTAAQSFSATFNAFTIGDFGLSIVHTDSFNAGRFYVDGVINGTAVLVDIGHLPVINTQYETLIDVNVTTRTWVCSVRNLNTQQTFSATGTFTTTPTTLGGFYPQTVAIGKFIGATTQSLNLFEGSAIFERS